MNTSSFDVSSLLDHPTILEVSLSPDGAWLAYVVEQIDAAADFGSTKLWLYGLHTREQRCVTPDGASDSSPAWAPDSTRLAVLSANQLHIVGVDGSRREVTDMEGGAGQGRWSPDGRTLLFAAQPPEPSKPAGAPLVIRHASYKSDGMGYKLGPAMQLYTVPADGGDIRQLTRAESDSMQADWSPDGSRIVFSRARAGARERHRYDLWITDPNGEGECRLTENIQAAWPAWSPDGKCIAYYDTTEVGDSRLYLYLYRFEDAKAERASKVELGSYTIEKMTPPQWCEEGPRVYTLGAHNGTTWPAALDLQTGESRSLADDEDEQVSLMSVSNGARLLAYKSVRLDRPEALFTVPLDGGAPTEVLRPAGAWAEEHEWPRFEQRWFDSPKGRRIHGWLVLPPGGGQKLPLLVDVHGGPHSYAQLGYPYHPDWFELASKGWAILSLNPTGSSSMGDDYAEDLKGQWGERDLDEHLSVVDDLVKEGVVDSERVAISGKSYGGYMAAWAVGHSNRFRTAVVSAPVADLVSHFGTSDSGYYVDPYDIGKEPNEEGMDLYASLSPIRCLHHAQTPVLILQGEDDQRCPLGQAEQVFNHLLHAGKAPVEMVIYPGGDHHLREQGKPSQRVDFNRRLVDWVECWDRSQGAAEATEA